MSQQVAGVLISAVAALLWFPCAWVAASEASAPIFAMIGDEQIALQDYEKFVQVRGSNFFFHGKKEVAASQRAIWTQQFVDRVLLLQETKRRGIKPTREDAQGWLAERVSSARSTRSSVETMSLARFDETARLHWAADEFALATLKQDVMRHMNPDVVQVRRYYEQHPEKFTTPEQLGISMILLEVAPYAPASTWEEARERAQGLYEALTRSVPFEELAQDHSQHASSRNGGNLGLVHVNMLSKELQVIAASLQPGQISTPQLVLQGVVIMRINERVPPRVNEFEGVSARARELLVRDLGDVAWQELTARLRETVPVVFRSAQPG